MRIILKPAGLLSILTAFAALSWLVVYLTQTVKAKDEMIRAVATPPPAKPNAGGAPKSTGPSGPASKTLLNPGFEDDYKPVVPYDTKAQLSGETAKPWDDDSSWAPVTVAYSQDKAEPHSGASCQKIAVQSIAAGKDVRVQFIQPLALEKGKRYRASLWMRAEQPTQIDFLIRQSKWPFQSYGVNQVSVGTEWKEAQVTGVVASDGDTFLMLKVSKPVTFWIDDASLQEEKVAAAP